MPKISKISTYGADPKMTTLARFVRSTMDPDNDLAKKVQQYRRKLWSLTYSGISVKDAKDKIKWMKKSLPLYMVGAICEGGHAMEHVVKKTGWIALDIDAGDNEHLTDAEAVRDAVGKLDFIAFAGLSVSGKGVWALLKVEDPQQQPQHYEQIKKDFEYFGITLDSSKGANANDKRFYSFDPNAYVADEFDVYDRLPQNKKVREKFHKANNSLSLNDSDKYGAAAFSDEIDTLSRTANGNRNNQLFKSTASLAQLVAGGVLNKTEVANTLYDTARSIGLKDYEIKTTIKSGFRAGMKEPRQPAPNSRAKPLPKKDRRSNGTCETKKIRQNGDTALENYPDEWDEITLEKGSQEYQEATRAMISDASPKELEEFYTL